MKSKNIIPADNQLILSCLTRIAESLERIEQPYMELLDRARRYTQLAEDRLSYIRKCDRQIAGLRGYIKRLQKKPLNTKK